MVNVVNVVNVSPKDVSFWEVYAVLDNQWLHRICVLIGGLPAALSYTHECN